ncbi:MAG: DEAD/DEAH box helicase family protein [Clostridia bacterium]
MSFRDVELKPEYRSRLDNMIRDFYNPVLKQAVIYKRAVGFFSSSALLSLTAGICGLIENGGSIQMIASPHLSPEDVDAINDGIHRRDDVIREALLRELHEPKGKFEEARLNLLSNLIATNKLVIKIAFLEDDNRIGMFHEKLGLMYDADSNIIAFSGSMNESANAFTLNYEAIDVYASWTQDADRVYTKQSAFNAMWEDYEPSIKVIDFPDINEEILRRYRINERIETRLDDEPSGECIVSEEPPAVSVGPMIPAHVHMRSYQMNAIEEWAKRDYVGIFDMATGTGKTYTALAAVVRLFTDLNQNLAVMIVCPYQHLVEQWKEDIVAFGMKPIVCYSASSQKNWRERLKTTVTSFNLGVQNHFCMVTTNATFSTDYVQCLVGKLNGNVVLIVDEAHNFGAENLNKALLPNIPYRLALSATIDRHGDPEGTQKLFDYFGEKCIEYTLKDAIDNDMLTPYHYHPVIVSLNEEELGDYLELTAKIRKNVHADQNGSVKLSEYAKMLLIKRARVVAGATAKIATLRRLMADYKDDNQILVYCGATTMHDVDYHEGKPPIDEARQIDIVAGMLGNDLGMRVTKFTSEENADERDRIKKDFAEGKHLQALVAIRCLDEGVNIPSIRTAFIMASSTNPKEYVQRRGRVLRKFPGKHHAVIYDFITLPIPLEQVDDYDADVIESVRSLANREIIRMKDFAAIAENPFDSDSLIAEFQRNYNIEDDGITKEDEEYV